jgi:hypothetical protein
MSFPYYSGPEKKEEKQKEYPKPLPSWNPENCPRCGSPMIRGWIVGTILGFKPIEKWPGTYERLTIPDYPVGGPLSTTLWKGGGIRSYFCKNCDLYVSYEQDPIQSTPGNEA